VSLILGFIPRGRFHPETSHPGAPWTVRSGRGESEWCETIGLRPSAYPVCFTTGRERSTSIRGRRQGWYLMARIRTLTGLMRPLRRNRHKLACFVASPSRAEPGPKWEGWSLSRVEMTRA
jgi:hypothetical protein